MVVIGLLGVVEYIDEDGWPWVRYTTGSYGPLDPADGPDVQVGSVVHVFDDKFEEAPRQLIRPQKPEPRFGIVRKVEADRSLVDTEGTFRWLPHASTVEWSEWSTVEHDEDGIQGEIAKEPLRYRDDPPTARTVHSRFRVKDGAIKDTFDGIAGLDEQIAEMRQIIDLMGMADELRAQGMRPIRGLLLAGESGTGKTMLARALANEAKAVYFHVRGPEIASKWVNESEEMLRASDG